MLLPKYPFLVEIIDKKTSIHEDPSITPKDPYYAAHWLFFLFGLGGWNAWDAMLAGLDYYDSRYKPHGFDPSFTFGFVFIWPLFIFNIALLYLQYRVSLTIRLNCSFVIIAV